MRVFLDACVLYPTVMREVILGAARAGLFVPLWSPRVLEEWARAVARTLPEAEATARAEIALLRARWPAAGVAPPADVQAALALPDPDDTHVLAAAIAGQADILLTLNRRDFPSRVLARHGIVPRDPDGFLFGLWQDHPEVMERVAEDVRAEAERLSGQPQPLRALLKKAGLPRLGKATG